MSAQKQVNIELCKGVAGDKVNVNYGNYAYTPMNPTAIDADGALVGGFVWPGASIEEATKTKGSATAVLGFVEREIMYPNYDVTSSGSLIAPKGCGLNVAVKGDFYCQSLTAATVGQKVFASNSDGTIKTGAAGGTVSGYTETAWVVKTEGAIGDIIVISNN